MGEGGRYREREGKRERERERGEGRREGEIWLYSLVGYCGSTM